MNFKSIMYLYSFQIQHYLRWMYEPGVNFLLSFDNIQNFVRISLKTLVYILTQYIKYDFDLNL